MRRPFAGPGALAVLLAAVTVGLACLACPGPARAQSIVAPAEVVADQDGHVAFDVQLVADEQPFYLGGDLIRNACGGFTSDYLLVQTPPYGVRVVSVSSGMCDPSHEEGLDLAYDLLVGGLPPVGVVVRLEAHVQMLPYGTVPVAPTTWGGVKGIYR